MLFIKYIHCLSTLPLSSFNHYCRYIAQNDGGANVDAITDDCLFYFVVEQPTSVEQVGGSCIKSPRWGGILVKIGDKVYPRYPVYHCPHNPRNTFSPQGFLNYASFQSVIVHTHSHITFIDHDGIESQLPLHQHYDLEYLDLQVMMFNHPCHAFPL